MLKGVAIIEGSQKQQVVGAYPDVKHMGCSSSQPIRPTSTHDTFHTSCPLTGVYVFHPWYQSSIEPFLHQIIKTTAEPHF